MSEETRSQRLRREFRERHSEQILSPTSGEDASQPNELLQVAEVAQVESVDLPIPVLDEEIAVEQGIQEEPSQHSLVETVDLEHEIPVVDSESDRPRKGVRIRPISYLTENGGKIRAENEARRAQLPADERGKITQRKPLVLGVEREKLQKSNAERRRALGVELPSTYRHNV